MGSRALALAVAAGLAGGCATAPSRVVVPVAGAGLALDLAEGSVRVESDGIQAVVRPSVWQGVPASLPAYVTPFHLALVNGTAQPLRYEYADLRLFDETRFQYTAMPPIEVRRLLHGWGEGASPAVGVSVGVALHWRRGPYWWDPWWWGPPYPYYYPPPPRPDDIAPLALPVGTLHPGARSEGFVYFPRLRPEAQSLTFEFHHRLGDVPRVLTLPFAVQRAAGGAARPAA